MTTVVNFFGGPGAGKSTMAAHVYAILKWKQISCELIPEWVKGKVWEESFNVLNNQIYVFGKQYHTMQRAANHLDLIVMDSPLFLSVYYGRKYNVKYIDQLEQLVLAVFDDFNNINIFLDRDKEYDPKGRCQTETEANQIDNELYNMLNEYDIPFYSYKSVEENAPVIRDYILGLK